MNWFAALLLAGAAAGATPNADPLDSLAWLAGRWERSGEGRRIVELWLPPDGGMMLGMHRDVREQKSTFFEYLRIEAREDGVFYVGSPQGKPGVDFKLVRSEEAAAVFENPTHDFPQRIEYRREGDELVARVGLLDDTQSPPQEWRWRKTQGL